jgi:hypothetical protein
MFEEYVYPGGFASQMRKLNPKFAPIINLPAIVIINGLQLALCVIVIIVGKSNLTFSLSVASLLLINSVMHIAATIIKRGYAPGLITSVIVYLPLSLYTYHFFLSAGELQTKQFVISGI